MQDKGAPGTEKNRAGMQEIMKEYPLIEKARALSVQKDYAHAAETYSALLEAVAKDEPEDSVNMCLIYLEYAKALLLANEDVIVTKAPGHEVMDDLEIAWEVLEIARRVFEKEDMRGELIKTYSLLSEVSLESNNFQDSLGDLEACLNLTVEKYGAEDRRTAEIYFRMAMNHELMENTGKAAELVEKVIEILDASKLKASPEEEHDLNELVAEMKERLADLKAHRDGTSGG